MEKARLAFDVSIIVLYLVPATFLFLLGLFCSGWNAGTGSGACSIALLEPLYETFYNTFFIPTLPALIIGAAYMLVVPVAFLGSIGFRIMSLSEGLAATKRDWFGFLVLGISILIFFASL